MNRFLAALAGLTLVWAALPGRGAELRVLVKDHHGKLIADAVVLATPVDPKGAQRAKPPADAVDQVDKQFVPYVKAVFVGSKVRFPNSDHIRHQVYSFSPAKKFELPLYAGADAPPVVFDKPGVVVLGCNIHDWMVGYIYVSETPFFAKTEAAGSAAIEDMPPGEYTVRVWHPSMEQGEETTARRVTVSADGSASVAWELGLKPTFRVPRVSGAGSPGYP
jgi:plastocyanin